MSNEHPPTGGEGTAQDGESSVSSDRQRLEIDLDALFEALGDAQRRQILGYLDATDDDVAAYSDLIEHVADDSGGESAADHDRIAVSLHHNHLPKLADAGIVEYDARSETVRYRGGPAVSDWLDLVQSYDPNGIGA
jgi:DNA-binding transcriptional ArsR family regulator